MKIRLAAFLFGIAGAPTPDNNLIGSSLVCAAGQDDPNGAGGGAGGGSGGKPGDLSQAHLDAINAVVKSQLARIDIPGQIAAGVTSSLPKLTESIVEAVKGQLPPPPAPDEKKKKNDDDNEIGQMKAVIAKLQAENKDRSDALARAEVAAREKALTDSFAAAVGAVGVREKLRTGAIATLRQGAKVEFDDDGNPVIEVKRTQYGSSYSEKIPISQYAAEWAKTDEGKEYLPAPGGRSTGLGARAAGQVGAVGTGTGAAPAATSPGVAIAAGMSDADFGSLVLQAHSTGGGVDD
jgi:hypothetical protein